MSRMSLGVLVGGVACPSHAKFHNYLCGRRSKHIRPGSQTWIVEQADGRIAVRHHSTDIAILNKVGEVELHTGGWRTATTKARIWTMISHSRFYLQSWRWKVLAPPKMSQARTVLVALGVKPRPGCIYKTLAEFSDGDTIMPNGDLRLVTGTMYRWADYYQARMDWERGP